MRKRILVVLPFAFFHPGGSALNSFYRVKSLAELENNIDIICYPHGDNINISNIKLYRSPSFRIFKYYQAGQYIKKIFYEFFILIKFLKLILKNKYDLIITHSISIFSTIIFKPLVRAKFIANVHGNLEVEVVKWKLSERQVVINLFSFVETKLLNRYNKIICIHKSVKDILLKNGISNDKIIVINNAVDSKEVLHKKKDNYFTILYTGTFVSVQNIELLIKTAILLSNEFRFVLVGAMESEFKKYNELIQSFNLKDRMEIYKRKTLEELVSFYKNADVVISPRVYGHDTPMKLFDYMNYGKCIVATRRSIHLEVLTDDNSYLFEPSPQSLADSLIYLKNNPRICRSFEKQAKADFEKYYSLNIMKKKYFDFLNYYLP